MRPPRRISIALIFALLATFLSPVIAIGCSVVYPTVHVWKTFRVRVMDHGHPVRTLRLVLKPNHSDSNSVDRAVSYSITDAKGYARFADLAPGSYFLSPEHGTEITEGAFVDVSPNGVVDRIVQLKWPNATPVPVRSMSGTLRLPDYYPEETQEQLSLSLMQGASERVIETTHTDSRGWFAFNDSLKPGLYFLQLSDLSGKDSLGIIAFNVKNDATEGAVDLDLAWTSCGLRHASPRRYQQIDTNRLCGSVSDVLGSAIPDASVWLLSSDEERSQVRERTQTNSSGNFAFKEQHEGTYRLLVKRSGFQPYIRAVHLDEGAERSDRCSQPIDVQMAVE
jgi:hypothetical protein